MIKMTVIKWFVLALTLSMPPSLVLAVEEQPRQYDIELLIFENLVAADNGEVWPADYSEWFEEPVDETALPNAGTEQRQWLTGSSLHLSPERNTFGKSSRYRPLAHFGWRQAVLDRKQAQAFEMPVENTTGSYVDGSVRVAVERYLHLYLDLQLHPASPKITTEAASQTDSLDYYYELPEIRLTERRRMRSKEVHYFDNPRFGVIALITPYEPPAAPEETTPEIPPNTQP
jgi:hypothetical protein